MNIQAINYYNNSIYTPGVKKTASTPAFSAVFPMINRKPSANTGMPAAQPVYTLRTSLSTKEEKTKYNAVSEMLDRKIKRTLNKLLKEGKLLNNISNDRSTVLDNLYKIVQNPRIMGLNKETILKETIETIDFPFIITQKFGDLPEKARAEILSSATPVNSNIPFTNENLDVHSSTCPAASIEFNLAHKMPAEFARMAESLSSEKMSVTKRIDINNLSQSFINTIWMLDAFKTPHKMLDWNTLEVELKPDRNAILRARVQNTYWDKGERSVIDVLMQSTFMNVGAQNTYDSMIDRRIPKYNDDDSGLIDIEKNFAEELATGKGKVCVTYQKMDDNGKLIGYECEQSETLQHIRDTLNLGDNVIIGYTYCDNDNIVIGGHEITIIGIEKGKNGKEYFVCNDTDDGKDEPIRYPVEELLPRIHHAGIPKSVLINNVEFIEGWKELMEIYKANKEAAYSTAA